MECIEKQLWEHVPGSSVTVGMTGDVEGVGSTADTAVVVGGVNVAIDAVTLLLILLLGVVISAVLSILLGGKVVIIDAALSTLMLVLGTVVVLVAAVLSTVEGDGCSHSCQTNISTDWQDYTGDGHSRGNWRVSCNSPHDGCSCLTAKDGGLIIQCGVRCGGGSVVDSSPSVVNSLFAATSRAYGVYSRVGNGMARLVYTYQQRENKLKLN